VRKILEAELDHLIEQNAKPEVCAAAARRLINFEPTHEGAARNLMRAFAQWATALRRFANTSVVGRRSDRARLAPFQRDHAVYEAIRIESPPVVAPLIHGVGVDPRETAAFSARWKIERQTIPSSLPSTTHRTRRGVNPRSQCSVFAT